LPGGGLPGSGQGGQDEAAQRPAALLELRHRIGLDSEAALFEIALEPAAATIHHDRVAENQTVARLVIEDVALAHGDRAADRALELRPARGCERIRIEHDRVCVEKRDRRGEMVETRIRQLDLSND